MANALWNVMEKMNLRGPNDSEYDEYADDYEYQDENWDDRDEQAEIVPMPQQMAAADLSRIVTVRPVRYGDPEMLALADSLKDGVPVIVHIGNMDERGQQSLLDFMAGVVYALDGHIERVTAMVYLLSPQKISIYDGDGNDLTKKRR